jgi:hypothetical protein
MDFATLVNIGGIWFGLFSFWMKRNLGHDEYLTTDEDLHHG